MHKDPAVYGPTAEEFLPERMLDEPFERLQKDFPDSWKPWGNGMRSCIGRPFAWQEAVMLTALLFQNFNFVHDNPGYQLSIKQTLTIKPKDFYMRAILRDGLTPAELEARLAGAVVPGKDRKDGARKEAGKVANGNTKGKPLNIYYGSNTGTCESLAQRLAADAAAHGFVAEVVDPLDMARQNLPKDRPAVIITSSYEGNPADNAALFCEWIQNSKGKEMDGVEYAVFGCGKFSQVIGWYWLSANVYPVLTFDRPPRLGPDLPQDPQAHQHHPL
jgi:cytochrome P450 / NADPH-cytochrome P450 reductase